MTNIHFYLYYVRTLEPAARRTAKDHPAVQRIMQWKKLADAADSIMATYADDVEHLVDALEQQQSIEPLLAAPVDLLQMKKEEAQKRMASSKKQQHQEHAEDEVDAITERPADYDTLDLASRRAIDDRIARNRGLTPHKAKKFQRHSRVKRRHHYDKMVSKRRSQVPDVRSQQQKYGGEMRGIKANLVKSVKLKA